MYCVCCGISIRLSVSGTDITFLSGLSYICSKIKNIKKSTLRAYTNASLIVREDYHFDDGLFSGYDPRKTSISKTIWNYEMDENGFAKRDTTLQHPRCVWNLLKNTLVATHLMWSLRFVVHQKEDFLKVCEYG